MCENGRIALPLPVTCKSTEIELLNIFLPLDLHKFATVKYKMPATIRLGTGMGAKPRRASICSGTMTSQGLL